MDPMTMMAIMAAGQGLMGIGQKIAGGIARRKAEKDFDKYEVPPSAMAMLQKAGEVASQNEIPGADMYRQKAMASAARGVEAAQRTAGSSSDVLGVLSRMYGDDYMNFEKTMATQGAQYKRQAQGDFQRALGQIAGYETQKWQYNELYPYMQKMNMAGQLDAAGGQNIGGAISSGVNIAGANWEMKQDQAMFDQQKALDLKTMGLKNPNNAPTSPVGSSFSTPNPMDKSGFYPPLPPFSSESYLNPNKRTMDDWWRNTQPQTQPPIPSGYDEKGEPIWQ
jgi:hypothetical protein